MIALAIVVAILIVLRMIFSRRRRYRFRGSLQIVSVDPPRTMDPVVLICQDNRCPDVENID